MWWAALITASAVLLGPLLIADVPPILDYPNHLARLVLLRAGPDDPVLGRLFTPHWTVIPNLAIDLIGPPLLRLLPVHVAGRCLLGAILLLNLAGVIALHRALFGRRSFWPLGAALVAYNSTFLLGFMNWLIGSGLAMLFAAAWLTGRDRRPLATIAIASVASVVLFFCHLMGLAFFLVLIGSAELLAAWRDRSFVARGAGLIPVIAGPFLLSLQTSLRDAPAALHWMSPFDKSLQVASPFINYILPLDLMTVAVVYGGVVVAVVTGRLAVAPAAGVAAGVLAAVYAVMPFDFKSGAFVDTRIAIMLGFLAFAGVDPVRPHAAAWRRFGILLAALFLARMGVVAAVWSDHRRDLAQLRQVIAKVPPGATVYLTSVPQDTAPAYWNDGPRSRRLSNTLRTEFHLPALLLIERGAFWSVLLANPAQQPIRLRPPIAELLEVGQRIPSYAELAARPERAVPALRAFDFVLMLEAGAAPAAAGFVPRCLALRQRTDFAALYRVLRDAPSCAGDPP